MTISNLRAEIIQKVNSTENLELLSEIGRLMNIHTMEEEVYELSEDQKSAIKEASVDYEQGNILSDEEANSEIDSWLKKK